MIHEGGFSVARREDGSLVFRRPDGREIPARPRPARIVGEALVTVEAWNRDAGVEIDADTTVPQRARDLQAPPGNLTRSRLA
jgi:hypothetical protein